MITEYNQVANYLKFLTGDYTCPGVGRGGYIPSPSHRSKDIQQQLDTVSSRLVGNLALLGVTIAPDRTDRKHS